MKRLLVRALCCFSHPISPKDRGYGAERLDVWSPLMDFIDTLAALFIQNATESFCSHCGSMYDRIEAFEGTMAKRCMSQRKTLVLDPQVMGCCVIVLNLKVSTLLVCVKLQPARQNPRIVPLQNGQSAGWNR